MLDYHINRRSYLVLDLTIQTELLPSLAAPVRSFSLSLSQCLPLSPSLPPSSSSSSLPSKHILHNSISESCHMHSVLHWLGETQSGIGYNIYQSVSKASAEIRGTRLLPFYFPCHSAADLSAISLSDLSSQSADTFTSAFRSPYPILSHITIEHARLLSRLCLNRSALNAVRAQHNSQVSPDCNCFFLEPMPQTVNHTISHCSKFALAREELRAKLYSFTQSLRHKESLLFASNNSISFLSHIILASPIVLKHISKSFMVTFISSTFVFLDFIFKLNPF
jgi:hypothetical protein